MDYRFSAQRKDNNDTVEGWLLDGKYICTDIAVSPFSCNPIHYIAPIKKRFMLFAKSTPMEILTPRHITLYEVLPETIKPLF